MTAFRPGRGRLPGWPWALFLVLGVTRLATAQQVAPLTASDVEAFAEEALAAYLREYDEPSLALAVVLGDSVLFLKGYGTEDPERRRPVDPEETLFNIASVSKLMVATAAMQLVERGGVTLDDDLESRLPGIPIAGTGPGVTLRNLLTHTSGLEGPFLREVVADPRELVSLADYFRRYPPRRGRAPGREIRYSNYAMALAGHLVERVSGRLFSDYVDREVFAPLGMTHSSFRQPPPAALAARVATAGAGPVPDALLPYPSGSMVSSAGDMARFMLAHLNGGRAGATRVLDDASVRQMHEPQWRADPRAPGIGLGFFESAIGGQRGLFHTGARIHFSLLYLLPEQRVGLFIVHAMQQGGAFQTLRTDFVRAFVARYVPREPPAGRHDSGADQRAAALAGIYRPHLLPTSTIERAANLFTDTRVGAGRAGSIDVAIPGGKRVSLAEIDSDVYRVLEGTDEGLTIAFQRDGRGSVRGMSMSGSTQDPITFERLAWYQRGTVHAVVLGVLLLLFAGGALTEFSGWLLRLVRRRRPEPWPRGARRAWWVAVAVGALVTSAPVSVGLLVLSHTGDDTAAHGLRRALTVGLTLLLAGAAVGLALVPLCLRAWRERYWGPARRVYFTVLAAGELLAAPLLWRYHLLGYWF